MRIFGLILLGALSIIFFYYGFEYLEKANRTCFGIECSAIDFIKKVGIVLIVIAIGFLTLLVIGIFKALKTK